MPPGIDCMLGLGVQMERCGTVVGPQDPIRDCPTCLARTNGVIFLLLQVLKYQAHRPAHLLHGILEKLDVQYLNRIIVRRTASRALGRVGLKQGPYIPSFQAVHVPFDIGVSNIVSSLDR